MVRSSTYDFTDHKFTVIKLNAYPDSNRAKRRTTRQYQTRLRDLERVLTFGY